MAASLFCRALHFAEALAIGALVHGGVGLMGAHLNGVQAAAVHVLAVMGAAGNRAVDGAVGGALADFMFRSSEK